MKQIILGTAGHIDHGKTTLIKSLTGIDTDRLKEEKLRGITIELGFASIDLSEGYHIGIIDVPGHEKFIKNMVAGATGIDIVAMVIAADEGVMPQTREHLEICSLLDVKHGLVVITKIDMVDEEWLELVIEDIANFTKGTFLENSDIVPVSATTGLGLDKFKKALKKLSDKVKPRSWSGLFRVPVDRVFTIKGFGTVITGTLSSGRINVGQTVMIYPSGITSKIRGIQVHNKNVDFALAGMRTAINFQGLEKTVIKRGDVLSEPGALKPGYMIDVLFHYLQSNKKPFKNRSRIRFHTGTSEVMGVLVVLEDKEPAPGKTFVAQIRLESPVALVKDDRFVARSYSPVFTIGGGRVLNPIAKKHKGFKLDLVSDLKKLTKNEPYKIISYQIEQSGYKGASFSALKLMTNIPEKMLDKSVQKLLSEKNIILIDREKKVYIHSKILNIIKNRLLDYLSNYHKENPLKGGIPKEELKSKIPSVVSSKIFNLTIEAMVNEKLAILEGNSLRLAGHKISLGITHSEIRSKILNIYKKSRLTPPYFKEIEKKLNSEQAKDVLQLLVDEKKLVKIKEDLYFNTEAVQDLEKKLVDFLTVNEEISTPQLKDMTGVSRKYLIPLIEYFDTEKLTIRIGDIRKLRKTR